jgi:hypothetical protein
VTFTRNGAGQSVTRTVVDRSGNVGSVTVGGIGIDQELPAMTAVTVADGAVYNEIQLALVHRRRQRVRGWSPARS